MIETLDLQQDALKRAKCRKVYEEHARSTLTEAMYRVCALARMERGGGGAERDSKGVGRCIGRQTTAYA
jgi:hypothetical protein